MGFSLSKCKWPEWFFSKCCCKSTTTTNDGIQNRPILENSSTLDVPNLDINNHAIINSNYFLEDLYPNAYIPQNRRSHPSTKEESENHQQVDIPKVPTLESQEKSLKINICVIETPENIESTENTEHKYRTQGRNIQDNVQEHNTEIDFHIHNENLNKKIEQYKQDYKKRFIKQQSEYSNNENKYKLKSNEPTVSSVDQHLKKSLPTTSNSNKVKFDIISQWGPKDLSLKIIQPNCTDKSMLRNATHLEYNEIKSLFMRTTQRHYKVIDIKKIINPYLKTSFSMKRKEYEILYGKENVKIERVFHGTTDISSRKIIKNNFNWRLHGTAKGNIYGRGVSFSPISNYASNYCDKTEEKCMFVVKVLICFSHEGNRSMVIPPVFDYKKNLHYDTSQNYNGSVLVKYRDDEFYPEYLIHFTGSPIKKTRR